MSPKGKENGKHKVEDGAIPPDPRRRRNDGGAGTSKSIDLSSKGKEKGKEKVEDGATPPPSPSRFYDPTQRRNDGGAGTSKSTEVYPVSRHIDSLRVAIQRISPRDLWRSKTLPFCYEGEGSEGGRVRLRYITLDQNVKHWLRDVGQSLYCRLCEGVGLKLVAGPKEEPIILADHIYIVDGQARLPDPSTSRHENTADLLPFVTEYQTLFKKQLLLSNVETPDNQSLLLCLEYLLTTPCPVIHRPTLFQTITCHYWFDSDYTKLTLLEHSFRILSTVNALWGYTRFMMRENCRFHYDIRSQLGGNPVLLSIYNYCEDNTGSAATYENNPIGVLRFCINVIKHADQHCTKLKMRWWTVEEKVVLLEHCFPKLFHNLFFFLWSHGISVDLNQILRNRHHTKR